MTTSIDGNKRLLRLEGAYNVRDIGGYEAAEGRTVQWGRFLRADGLHRLTSDDQDKIVGMGIRTVIDLRHARELEQKRNVFNGSERANYYNISLINPAASSNAAIRSLGDLYVNMLDECGPLLKEVFGRMAEAEGDCVLFHCTAGKDRTGVVAALLLDLAGVERSVIIADYAETEANLSPIMDELRKDRPEQIPADMYELFLGSAPSNMALMLDHLHDAFGGAESYLARIGLGEKQIAGLKRMLLQP
ncbi:tyrosine-protein phosphatase [Paenibacillus arenilitoris]|uniref:Tyrosine-protein phosphatase n=1 Tax=Paenibacillus arenilitoris TaxID=2772299 RepID=A0A927CJ71_9BACL|nr:tyrosine-protein phosphatase [Paenibacillus arenilitoris]MBD2869083.1 tyrosine-protein phosphatase [Paenibacillus arenilitoris]